MTSRSDTSLWNRLGGAWDRLWYASPRATRQEVAAILAILGGGRRLPPRTRFLDVGCGTGRHAVALAALGHRVVGVDRAPAMIRAAREKARGRRVARRARFLLGDARALPVRAGAFDVALSLCEGAFGGPEDPRADRDIVREAARALRPGGALVLVALSRPWLDRHGDWRYDPARGRSVGREVHELEDRSRVEVEVSTRAYRPAAAARLLERCGLEVALRLGAAPGAYGAFPPDAPDAMQYLLVGVRGGGRRGRTDEASSCAAPSPPPARGVGTEVPSLKPGA